MRASLAFEKRPASTRACQWESAAAYRLVIWPLAAVRLFFEIVRGVMRSILRPLAYLAVAIALIVVIFAVWAYYATQQVPSFYEQALEVDEQQLAVASDEMVRRTTELISNTNTQGNWEAVFTAKQINGWLAVDLPNNHPDVLPSSIRAPRVAISPEGVHLACRYATPWMTTVASLLVHASLREDNVLALRFRKARAGTLPLPLKDILDELTEAARQAEIRLRWEKVDDDPVALIDIPAVSDGGKQVVVSIDTLELRDGEILLRGRTQPAEAMVGRKITQFPFHTKIH